MGAPAASGGKALAGRSQASVRRLGTTTHDGCCEDTYSALLQRFQRSEEELRAVAAEWLQCQKRIDAYVDEQVGAREGCAGGRACGRWGLGGPGRGHARGGARGAPRLRAACGASGSRFGPRELTLAVRSLGAHARGTHSAPRPPTLLRLNGSTGLGHAGGSSVGRQGTGPCAPACLAARAGCLPHLGGGSGEVLDTELS